MRTEPGPILRFAASLALVAALSGCGDDAPKASPPPPPGAAVAPSIRSTDPAVAKVQEYVDRRTQSKDDIDKSRPDWRLRLPMRPKITNFDPAKAYVWTLATEVGSLQIRLHATQAPDHVAAVAYLTLLGFYDGLSIYSIVPGKALESGDPADDGKGSPGWAMSPEVNGLKHDRRGLVSAISHGPSTDDSKFRITFAADPSLDPLCTVFGEVEAGLETLKALEALGSAGGRPSKRVTITKATLSIR